MDAQGTASNTGRRPVAVGVVAWVSIGFGTFFFLAYALAAAIYFSRPTTPGSGDHEPTAFLGWNLPLPIFWTLALAIPLLLIVDGLGLLKGKNWARLLGTLWWTFCLLSLVYTYGLNIVTGIQAGICLLTIFFLNTTSARTFFKQQDSH